MKHSAFKCPSCGQALAMESYDRQTVLWCSQGPCESVRANDGAMGVSELKAFELLKSVVLIELAEREDMRAQTAAREAENLEWKRRAEGSRYAL